VRPTFLQILRRTLRTWIFLPGILFILVLGALQANNAYRAIEKRNRVVSGAISYYITTYISDALYALKHFSKGIGPATKDMNKNLETFYNAYPHFERLLWLSKDKIILTAAPFGAEGLPFPIRMDIRHEGGIISKPIVSPGSGQPVLYLGVKYHTGNILVGEMDTLALSQHLGGLLPPGNTIILADAYGNIVSHPDLSKVLRQENIGDLPLMAAPHSEERVRTSFFTHDGTLYIGSLATIPGENWKIIISSKASTVFIPILETVLALLALLTTLFLLFSALLNNALKAGLVLPLDDLIHDIKQLGMGADISDKPIRSTYRELETVEEEFRKMCREVRGREEELSENAERYRALFHDNQLVLLLVDPLTGDILDNNKRAVEYYGYAQNTLRSLTLFDINAESGTVAKKIMERPWNSGAATTIRTKHTLASGEVREVDLLISPMTIHGTPRNFVTVIDASQTSRGNSDPRDKAES